MATNQATINLNLLEKSNNRTNTHTCTYSTKSKIKICNPTLIQAYKSELHYHRPGGEKTKTAGDEKCYYSLLFQS